MKPKRFKVGDRVRIIDPEIMASLRLVEWTVVDPGWAFTLIKGMPYRGVTQIQIRTDLIQLIP